jgi:hypothetical protein
LLFAIVKIIPASWYRRFSFRATRR